MQVEKAHLQSVEMIVCLTLCVRRVGVHVLEACICRILPSIRKYNSWHFAHAVYASQRIYWNTVLNPLRIPVRFCLTNW